MRVAERIAVDRDWPANWLNSKATQFFPDWGQNIDWKPLYHRDRIRGDVMESSSQSEDCTVNNFRQFSNAQPLVLK
jgi:hypothetical protein